MYYRDGWYKLNFGQDELVSGNIIPHRLLFN
ncbi:Uncharacterised protein [Klebsiella quasipneumoniae]|nr:Uncharacterised protein [Klebsiella quasipneumoniae]